MRGGTHGYDSWCYSNAGLSPLARGNLRRMGNLGLTIGSIPACAGEPPISTCWISCTTVYPRLRGGTQSGNHNPLIDWGLSPLARGNPLRPVPPQLPRGSIPACAGEPLPPDSRPNPGRVYPRLRGGTSARLAPMGQARGLSPLARGNLAIAAFSSMMIGSIPACAGEPS